MPPQITVMGGKLGDIFWDLPPWITYSSGFDLGCVIYIANPTNEEKEYALMAKLSSDSTVISEEALPVFGYTWFKVDPGDFIRLYGALRFDETDCDLTVSLTERETGEAADSIVTRLVSPYPAWPPWGVPGMPTTPTDWFSMLLPLMMLGIMGMVMGSALRPRKEKREEAALPVKEKKLLPPGRKE